MTIRADGRIIVNDWQDSSPAHIRVSSIIDGRRGCEGIDVRRYETTADARLELPASEGHVFSLLKGAAILSLGNQAGQLTIDSGTHLYVPPAQAASFEFTEESSAIHAFAPGDRDHGKQLLVHNERYLAAARFVLTPQYLSRRAFLNRDHTLVSRLGHRIAWFHTTMFDTQGLPPNHDGLPVFKMSYDNQTELNVVYEVGGEASVRFARHPYVDPPSQSWSDWYPLDGETTYYLNECADGPEIERHVDPETGKSFCLRNRHEIYIANQSHVSLCCLFDPGPTGLETHRPGEYSSYAPVAETVGTEEYVEFLASVKATDRMLHSLSYEQALNAGEPARSSPQWQAYETLLAAALRTEQEIVGKANRDRRQIMEPWRIIRRTDS